TVTPGSAPPVASTMRPLIVPVCSGCAASGAAISDTAAASSQVVRCVGMALLPAKQMTHLPDGRQGAGQLIGRYADECTSFVAHHQDWHCRAVQPRAVA